MRLLATLLLAAAVPAQLRLNEVLADPVGADAGQQVVELLNLTNRPVSLGGWHLVGGGAAHALPNLDLPPDQITRVHVGAGGTSTPSDLFLPAMTLAHADSLALFRSAQVTLPDDLVDFVSFGGGTFSIGLAVQAGRWPSVTDTVALPAHEGDTVAHLGDAAWVAHGSEAWYRDHTPTLGSANDAAGIFNIAAGCPSFPYGPSLGLARPESRPWLGEAFELDIFYLPTQATPFALFLGGAMTAPVALDAVGLTGCSSHIRLDLALPLFAPGHDIVWRTTLPAAPELLRLAIYYQALVPHPDAPNPARALVSNAIVTFFGSR